MNLSSPRRVIRFFGLLVDALGVGLEDVVAALTRGVLQPEHRLRVEQVRLAVAAPLVLAAGLQDAVRLFDAVRRVGESWRAATSAAMHVQADAAQLGLGAGEVLVDELLGQAQRLEGLRAA